MIPYKQYLQEGGWASTLTQSTKLTPAITQKALEVLPRFEKDFNKFLAQHGVPPVKVGKAVGSSAYWAHDLKVNPTKEYGDIDVIFSLPDHGGEAKTTALYRKFFLEFLATVKPSYASNHEGQTGQNITLKIGKDWVQVDLVATLSQHEDWATSRMTPEHGLKGAFIGFLYASLAQVLHVSISTTGVQSKVSNGDMVPFTKQKVDAQHTVSSDIETFALDLFLYIFKRYNKGTPKISPMLTKHKGMRKEQIKFSDLANAIKGIGKSFEMNNMYGKGVLKDIHSYDEFIAKLKVAYQQKADRSLNSSKFDKATTPEAIKRAADTKHQLQTQTKELLKQL